MSGAKPSSGPLTLLGGLSANDFIREYWQQKPLLIRQGLPGYQCPVDENDLAGLALESSVESRLIWEQHEGKPWQLENGPFDERKLQTLPTEGWTLLVQGLDHWVPEIAELLDAFRFLPNWRLDDIMASFSPPGGSVGPHYDQYDVFLIQAKGRRRWQVGPPCDGESPRVEDTPLRILADMPVSEEWVLEPGDILYLPPGLAHHGVSLDPGITLSVGFRSPTLDEMLPDLLGRWLADPIVEQSAFSKDLAGQGKPWEISDSLVTQVRDALLARLSAEASTTWIGQFLTEPKSEHVVQAADPLELPEKKHLRKLLRQGRGCLFWNEGSRFLLAEPKASETAETNDLEVFVDGHSYRLNETLRPAVARVCQSSQIPLKALKDWEDQGPLLDWLLQLMRQGSLQPPMA